jgi:hypothetical protein
LATSFVSNLAFNVCYWHLADIPTALALSAIGLRADKGVFLARDGLSAFDPTATSAVRCGNGFDADFNTYQSTRLSR